MYVVLTKKSIFGLKDAEYELKKELSVLNGNILKTEYEFQRKIDEFKSDFGNKLQSVLNAFYANEEDQNELILSNKRDMKQLTKRRTDIKESYNISLYALENCEKEVGVDLLYK